MSAQNKGRAGVALPEVPPTRPAQKEPVSSAGVSPALPATIYEAHRLLLVPVPKVGHYDARCGCKAWGRKDLASYVAVFEHVMHCIAEGAWSAQDFGARSHEYQVRP